MKKYTIKDSQGSKKTIYAENITHALTFVDSKIEDEVSLAEIDEAIDNIADKYGGFYSRTYDKVFKDLKVKYPNLKYEDVRRAIINYAENSSSANAQLRVAKKYFSDSVNDVDISFDKRIKNAVERGKLRNPPFDGLYAIKASKAEFPELKQELEKRKYKNIMFSNNPYNRYNVFFRDEASLATTINALVNDEKAAIDSYNVAIKNLEGKIDETQMQVLINIMKDERRHVENLYAILNGQVTEKNLEDSAVRDDTLEGNYHTEYGDKIIVSKIDASTYRYFDVDTKSAIRVSIDALKEDIKAKRLLKDSIHDALDVEGYANYGLRIKNQLAYDIFYDGHRKGLDFNAVLKNYDSIAKQILAKIKEYLYDAKKTLISFNKH